MEAPLQARTLVLSHNALDPSCPALVSAFTPSQANGPPAHDETRPRLGFLCGLQRLRPWDGIHTSWLECSCVVSTRFLIQVVYALFVAPPQYSSLQPIPTALGGGPDILSGRKISSEIVSAPVYHIACRTRPFLRAPPSLSSEQQVIEGRDSGLYIYCE